LVYNSNPSPSFGIQQSVELDRVSNRDYKEFIIRTNSTQNLFGSHTLTHAGSKNLCMFANRMSLCIGTEIHNVGTFGLNGDVANTAMLEILVARCTSLRHNSHSINIIIIIIIMALCIR
jgi:hypothetical protein